MLDRSSEFFSIAEVLRRSHEAQQVAAGLGPQSGTVAVKLLPKPRAHHYSQELAGKIKSTALLLVKLQRLARKKSLFDDPAAEFAELSAKVKTELQTLDAGFRVFLAECTRAAAAERVHGGSEELGKAYWASISETLRGHMLLLARSLQDALRARTESIKQQSMVRHQFAKSSWAPSVDLSSAALFSEMQGFGGGGGGAGTPATAVGAAGPSAAGSVGSAAPGQGMHAQGQALGSAGAVSRAPALGQGVAAAGGAGGAGRQAQQQQWQPPPQPQQQQQPSFQNSRSPPPSITQPFQQKMTAQGLHASSSSSSSSSTTTSFSSSPGSAITCPFSKGFGNQPLNGGGASFSSAATASAAATATAAATAIAAAAFPAARAPAAAAAFPTQGGYKPGAFLRARHSTATGALPAGPGSAAAGGVAGVAGSAGGMEGGGAPPPSTSMHAMRTSQALRYHDVRQRSSEAKQVESQIVEIGAWLVMLLHLQCSGMEGQGCAGWARSCGEGAKGRGIGQGRADSCRDGRMCCAGSGGGLQQELSLCRSKASQQAHVHSVPSLIPSFLTPSY